MCCLAILHILEKYNVANNLDLKALRGISLEEVAISFGGAPDAKDPKRNWRINGQRITITDSQFYNHDADTGGGGAIDFATHLLGYEIGDKTGFKKAVSHLANENFERAVEQYILESPKHVKAAANDKVNAKTEPPPPNPDKLPRVIRYLTEHRGIPRNVVEREIEGGRLYADAFGNAVFKLTDPMLTGKQMGVELRGTIPDKPFHGVRGAEKGFYFCGTTKEKIATFVEAGIDALSFIAQHPDKMAVATVGSRKETMQECAKNLMKQGFEIRSGFDLDKTGERLTNSLKEVVGIDMKQEVPTAKYLAKYQEITGQPGKDWNDAQRGKTALEQTKSMPQGKEQDR